MDRWKKNVCVILWNNKNQLKIFIYEDIIIYIHWIQKHETKMICIIRF